MNTQLQAVLTEIVDRMSDLSACIDAMEAASIRNRFLTSTDIHDLFAANKDSAEKRLANLRTSIASLQL